MKNNINKSKIGVLVADFLNIKDWEWMIINSLEKESDIELIIINYDHSLTDLKNDNNFSENKLGNFLLKFQLNFEKKNTNIKNFNINVQSQIRKLSSIQLESMENSNEPTFNLIINLGMIAKPDYLFKLSKNGIIEVVYNNSIINEQNPNGIIEIVRNIPSIELSIIYFTNQNKIGVTLDKAFYNFHWSAFRNNYNALNYTTTFLLKNIKLLINDASCTNNVIDYKNKNAEEISLNEIFKYLGNFYYNVFVNAINKIRLKLFDIKNERWTLFFGNDRLLSGDLKNIKKVNLKRNEFWADPFLFEYLGELYVFFEKYTNKNRKGIISCGKYKNGNVIDVIDVLDLNYHLSYPNVFEDEGFIYMIPETSENEQLEIYKCIDFPKKWVLYSAGFKNMSIVDTIYYKDKKGEKWLFFNKSNNHLNDNCSELYIYRVDSLQLNRIEAHKRNPVIINSMLARNGGAIFEYENRIIRPSQNNTHGIYGLSINFNEIKKLDINDYQEVVIKEFGEPFSKMKKIHHFNQLKNDFVFDGNI